MTLALNALKFPIGKYHPNKKPSPSMLNIWTNEITQFPSELSKTISNLTEEQMRWRYRPDGWTIIQLIHHCADSHMNAFIRFKLALTEEVPIIKPYKEADWAELADVSYSNIAASIGLLTHLHAKWAVLINHLSVSDLAKIYVHPEHGIKLNLGETIGNYAWHGAHHLAHINLAILSKGKFNA